MRRREFIAVLGGAMVVWPVVSACATGGEAADHRISWFEHAFSHEWMDGRICSATP